MITDVRLHQIRTGEASAHDARKVIAEYLQTAALTGYPNLLAALRAWTWKAIHSHRFDADMVRWFHVLRGTAATMKGHDPAGAAYVQALAELVDDSLRFSAARLTQADDAADEAVMVLAKALWREGEKITSDQNTYPDPFGPPPYSDSEDEMRAKYVNQARGYMAAKKLLSFGE